MLICIPDSFIMELSMRKGETKNCVFSLVSDVLLLPIVTSRLWNPGDNVRFCARR